MQAARSTSPGLAPRGTTAGSIEGAGSYVLGDKNLEVGSNDASTEVSGVISGVGGSLTKVGNGTLDLSGTNTYTGATTVDDGCAADHWLHCLGHGGCQCGWNVLDYIRHRRCRQRHDHQ